MKVILTVGNEFSDFESVHKIIEHADSRGNVFTCSGVKFFKSLFSNELSKSADAGFEENALNMFLANSDQGILDFMQADIGQLEVLAEFDQLIFFVLVYSSPECSLSVSAGLRELSPADVDECMSNWTFNNKKLLYFFHKYPQRSILVNSATAISAEAKLISLLDAFPTLELECQSQSQADSDSVNSRHACVASVLSRVLITDYRQAADLYLELESVSHLPAFPAANGISISCQAWNEYAILRKNLISAQKNEINHIDAINKNGIYIKELITKSDDQSIRISELTLEDEDLRAAMAGVSLQLNCLQQENELLNAENELLLSQLQDAQEEIDIFAVPVFKSIASPALKSEFFIDMRKVIDGDNWYYAEHDGRWAGPGSASKLRIDALQGGEYEARFEVVDAIDKKILSGTTVALNGIQLPIHRKGRGVTGCILVKFSTEDIQSSRVWEFELKFPKLISPAQFGSADSRLLAIRVRSVHVVKIS